MTVTDREIKSKRRIISYLRNCNEEIKRIRSDFISTSILILIVGFVIWMLPKNFRYVYMHGDILLIGLIIMGEIGALIRFHKLNLQIIISIMDFLNVDRKDVGIDLSGIVFSDDSVMKLQDLLKDSDGEQPLDFSKEVRVVKKGNRRGLR